MPIPLFSTFLSLLTITAGATVSAAEFIEFRNGREFAPVSMESPAILPGSALDLSDLIDAPSGQYGRIIVAPDGTLTTEKDPDRKIRLFGGNGLPYNLWHSSSNEEFKRHATEFAAAFRRQGYNCLRLHGIDQKLMTGTAQGSPLEFQPEYLDRWDWLLAEMKKQGCYFQLVIFSFHLYEPETNHERVFRDRRCHKLMMYLGRDFERNRFREAVQKLLHHVNPYTGIAWKDDPAFAVIEFYNEQYDAFFTLPFLQQNYPEEYKFFLERWEQFLKTRYAGKNNSALPPELRNGFAVSVPGTDASAALQEAFVDFRRNLIRENNEFCIQTIRETGYKGILTQNTFPQYLFAAASWESIESVDGHGYFQHPTRWSEPGSRIRKISSAAQGAPLFRNLNNQRLSGRPFFVGEFNHCFWNPYQHELPLAFSAYAALNDFSSHIILGDPVWVEIPGQFRRANVFDVGRSPVQRAGEFLSALFFLRGDVRPATHRVVCRANFEQLNKLGLALSHAGEQGRLGLLTNYSLAFSDLPLPSGMPLLPQPDLSFAPVGGGTAHSRNWYTEIAHADSKDFRLADAVDKLREHGILPTGNITDPEGGVYQSETGELILREGESQIQFISSKSEAVTLPAGRAVRLGALNVHASSADALIGIAAMDGKTIRQSERLVLIYATQMANQGMKLEADAETLIDLGGAPSLLKTGNFHLSLENENAGQLRCYALRLNGERRRELPISRHGTRLEIKIDTAELGPELTTFFELSVSPAAEQ